MYKQGWFSLRFVDVSNWSRDFVIVKLTPSTPVVSTRVCRKPQDTSHAQRKDKQSMDIDNVFTRIGEFGSAQKKIFYILCTNQIFLGFHALALAFIGPEPAWSCGRKEDEAERCAAFEKKECSPLYSNEFTSIVSEVYLSSQKVLKEYHIVLSLSLSLSHHTHSGIFSAARPHGPTCLSLYSSLAVSLVPGCGAPLLIRSVEGKSTSSL